MKKGFQVFMVALLAGVVAFCAVRWHKAGHHHFGKGIVSGSLSELVWLKQDLELSEEQFSKV